MVDLTNSDNEENEQTQFAHERKEKRWKRKYKKLTIAFTECKKKLEEKFEKRTATCEAQRGMILTYYKSIKELRCSLAD